MLWIIKDKLYFKYRIKERLSKQIKGKELFKLLQELIRNWWYSWEKIEEKIEIKDWEVIWKWVLDLRWTPIDLQIQIAEKINNWELKVKW